MPRLKPGQQRQRAERKDWHANHILVEKEFFKLLDKFKRCPTNEELADELGWHENTVQAHMAQMDMSKITQETRMFGKRIMLRQAMRAMKDGIARDVITFAKLNYGWVDRARVEVENKDVDRFDSESSYEEQVLNEINRVLNSDKKHAKARA